MWCVIVNAERVLGQVKRQIDVRFIHDGDDPPPTSTEVIREILMAGMQNVPFDIRKIKFICMKENPKRRETDV